MLLLYSDDGDGNTDRDEGEKKTKHDETLTDGGSETEEYMANFEIDNCDSETEEDLANFDFESYDSENDPDYEVNYYIQNKFVVTQVRESPQWNF